MKQPAHARCARAAQIFPAFSQLFFRVFFFGFALVEKNIRGKIEKQKKTISDSSNGLQCKFKPGTNKKIPNLMAYRPLLLFTAAHADFLQYS